MYTRLPLASTKGDIREASLPLVHFGNIFCVVLKTPLSFCYHPFSNHLHHFLPTSQSFTLNHSLTFFAFCSPSQLTSEIRPVIALAFACFVALFFGSSVSSQNPECHCLLEAIHYLIIHALCCEIGVDSDSLVILPGFLGFQRLCKFTVFTIAPWLTML